MNKISVQRKKIGISQARLADELGWTRSRISNYESGIREPGLVECRAIVSALNKLGNNCLLDDVFPIC